MENTAQDYGYITSYASGYCGIYEIVDVEMDENYPYVDMVNNDHDFMLGCDPILFPYYQTYGPYNGPNSFAEKCFLG